MKNQRFSKLNYPFYEPLKFTLMKVEVFNFD